MNKTLLEQNIINLLSLQALPDGKKIALLDKMTELVQKRLALRITETLPGGARAAFIDASAAGDGPVVEQIVAEHINNLPEMIEQEVLAVKEELKSVVDALH